MGETATLSEESLRLAVDTCADEASAAFSYLTNYVAALAKTPISFVRSKNNPATEAWQNLIDHKLIEWSRDPSMLEDDGIDAPSGETIRDAINLANFWKKQGWPAPTRIVPDSDGGIVFELEDNDVFCSYRLSLDRTLEHCVFQDMRLVRRKMYDFPVNAGF